ncbi:MAG: hypothetical protein ACK559_04400, partial [bacterium]
MGCMGSVLAQGEQGGAGGVHHVGRLVEGQGVGGHEIDGRADRPQQQPAGERFGEQRARETGIGPVDLEGPDHPESAPAAHLRQIAQRCGDRIDAGGIPG